MSLVLVTLQATYRSGVTAQPMTGHVIVEPIERRVTTANDIIYAADPVDFQLNDAGGLQATVATGDDPTDPPYVYRITEKVGEAENSYEVTVPSMPDGSIVNLADVQQDGTWLAADIKLGGFGGF